MGSPPFLACWIVRTSFFNGKTFFILSTAFACMTQKSACMIYDGHFVHFPLGFGGVNLVSWVCKDKSCLPLKPERIPPNQLSFFQCSKFVPWRGNQLQKGEQNLEINFSTWLLMHQEASIINSPLIPSKSISGMTITSDTIYSCNFSYCAAKTRKKGNIVADKMNGRKNIISTIEGEQLQ